MKILDIALTKSDSVRFSSQRDLAKKRPLVFLELVELSYQAVGLPIRKIVDKLSTKDSNAYELLTSWKRLLEPKIDELYSLEAEKSNLSKALAKSLFLEAPQSKEQAKFLLDERVKELTIEFIDRQWYDARTSEYEAARELLLRPTVEVSTIHRKLVDLIINVKVSNELKLTIYDPQSQLIKRSYQRIRSHLEVKRYRTSRTKRLREILERQETIRLGNNTIVGKVLSLRLDGEMLFVLDAHRQYAKKIDKLSDKSKTSSRILKIYETSVKPIREKYTMKLNSTDKLSDLKLAVRSLDDALIEIFDMKNAERNSLVLALKEYRELEKEKLEITEQLSTNHH